MQGNGNGEAKMRVELPTPQLAEACAMAQKLASNPLVLKLKNTKEYYADSLIQVVALLGASQLQYQQFAAARTASDFVAHALLTTTMQHAQKVDARKLREIQATLQGESAANALLELYARPLPEGGDHEVLNE